MGSTSADAPRSDVLDALLAEIVRGARAAWPTVTLAPEAFVRHLSERLPAGVPADEALRQLHTTDLYLACACAEGDAHALAAFESHVLAVIDRALAPLPLDADAVAEVKQVLRHNLLVGNGRRREILDFLGRGDLRGWVRVMAVRVALSMLRRARRSETADDALLDGAVGAQEDPELSYLKRKYGTEFKSAVTEALRGLSARERTLLRQQVIDKLSIDEIGTLYRVHRATAARWLTRARQTVQTATRAALMQRLALEPAELDSILRLINSRLEVSLAAFFRQRQR